MQKALLLNGALIALALGSLGVVWATRDAPTTGDVLARKNQLFPELSLAKISAVELSNGERTLELRREGSEFRIVAPWSERADVATMNKWLNAADMAMVERPADGVSDARAGFGPSAFRAQIDAGGELLKLTLGGPAPTPTGARYAKVEAAGRTRIGVVRGSVASELEIPFDQFRETRLLEYGRRELAKLTLESSAGTIELEQRERGAFFVRVGSRWELAHPRAVRVIVEHLARLTTERFIEPEAARAALGASPVRLKLEPRDAPDSPVSLTLGGSCPSDAQLAVLLREQPGRAARAGCVDTSVVRGLSLEADAARLRGPFAAEADEIEELRVVRGAQKLELSRKDNGFVLRAPTSSEVPLNVGNQRIQAILNAQGELATSDVVGAGSGEVTIQIAGGDEASHREERVLLGEPSANGGVCFKRLSDDVTRCVNEEHAGDLEPDARLLRNLSLLEFSPSELSSFSVETPELQQRVLRRPDGGYELEAPKGFSHDAARVTEAVQRLGSLQALRWVAARDEPAFGFEHASLRVQVRLASTDEPRELVVGAKQRGAYFARLSPDPAVFLLAGEVYSLLSEPLIDRSLSPIPEAELDRVELQARGGKPHAPEAKLREALLALRASGVAHLGPARPSEGFRAPQLTLSFVAKSGKKANVKIGRCEPQESAPCYARRDDVDATFTLHGEIAASLRNSMEP